MKAISRAEEATGAREHADRQAVIGVELVERGGFGTAFSLQNTLQRSSPLILTALCVALPARIGSVCAPSGHVGA